MQEYYLCGHQDHTSILIKHYEDTLGAYHFKNQRMIIETEPARLLVEKYFKD